MRIIVTGTDTGIGKTVFAAALASALRAAYWKPIQSGLDGEESDSETVARLAPHAHVLPEAYRLNAPVSPHLAAALDNVVIDPAKLCPPATGHPLVIEGAGGVLVPVVADLLMADLFTTWDAPAVIVARTSLGTINHSLLTIEALRKRNVPILGVAFVGEANEDSEATIAGIGDVRRLGRLPRLDPLTPKTLAEAFAAGFDSADFR